MCIKIIFQNYTSYRTFSKYRSEYCPKHEFGIRLNIVYISGKWISRILLLAFFAAPAGLTLGPIYLNIYLLYENYKFTMLFVAVCALYLSLSPVHICVHVFNSGAIFFSHISSQPFLPLKKSKSKTEIIWNKIIASKVDGTLSR